MKEFLKIILLTVIVSFVFSFISVLIPYSQSFREISSSSSEPTDFIYFLVTNFFCCCAIFYVIKNSTFSALRTILCLSVSLPCIYTVMTQVETLFFVSAFPALTKMDILLIVFCNSFSLLVY